MENGISPPTIRLIRGVADAGDGEEGLRDQRAGEQTRQAAADDGDQRDEGVAEGVVIDDLLFGKTLGACGADIVRVEHLEHIVRV